MIHVGFTGTRHGMTFEQKHNVRSLLVSLQNANPGIRLAAHHGDCVGADAEFHEIAGWLGCWLVGHPPVDTTHAAGCAFDERRPPLTHMKRNRAIVAGAAYMIGAPFDMTEQERGGTWATIRMARKAGKRLATVLPDGSLLGQWDDVQLETMIGKAVRP